MSTATGESFYICPLYAMLLKSFQDEDSSDVALWLITAKYRLPWLDSLL